jgi:RHS repeat-associated protein
LTQITLQPQNSIIWRFYYYAGSARIAMRIKDNTNSLVFYLFADHLGSTNVTSDPSGQLVSLSLYKAWGESRGRAGTLLTDYGFNGQRSMEGTIGLQYFNARWYDSSLGRWAQPDSILPIVSQGVQAWDRYEFTNNNSVNFTDSTGHSVDCGLMEPGCKHIPLADEAYTQPYDNNQDDNNQPSNQDQKKGGKRPISDTISRLPGSAAYYSKMSTGIDVIAWVIDLYAAGIVISGGIFGFSIPAVLLPEGIPEVPVTTGIGGMLLAELPAQTPLKISNYLATGSTVATFISDTKNGTTIIEESMFSSSTLNSISTTVLGWVDPEALTSLVIQSISVSNDFGWISLPFPISP